MLNRIPLRASCRVMTHGHGQGEAIADLDLQSLLPGSSLTTIAATRVGQQQKMIRSCEPVFAFSLPPSRNGVGGERWRVARGANPDESAIVRDVIHAVRDGTAERVVRVVMHVDGCRLSRPGLPGIFEVAHELLLAVKGCSGLSGGGFECDGVAEGF